MGSYFSLPQFTFSPGRSCRVHAKENWGTTRRKTRRKECLTINPAMLPTTSIVLRNEETKKKQTNKAMHLRFRWIPSKYGFFCRLQCFEVCFAVFCCVLACVSRCPIVFVCGSVADFRTFPLSMFLVSQVAIPLLVIWAGILLLLSGISCGRKKNSSILNNQTNFYFFSFALLFPFH